MTVKVKPLVWVDTGQTSILLKRFYAVSGPLKHTVHPCENEDGSFYEHYGIRQDYHSKEWVLSFWVGNNGTSGISGKFPTPEAAKAAAQADYEARILAAIEAPAQEPVAWQCKDYADGWITYTARNADQAREYQEATGCTIRPLYTTPPDHLALVAAAYRDAAEQCQKERWNVSHLLSNPPQSDAARMIGLHIADRTPADAEAHLTALLRAEYERGVREAAAKMAEPAMLGLTLTKMEQSILALLTQEGR